MPHELPKAYDPTAIEDHWAEYWVRENLFATPTPTNARSKPAEGGSLDGRSAFTILLPPPNVTGRLHMGHMLNQTEMDILTRWHRMRRVGTAEPTLWVPGTDHAGIATQMMVEKQVTAEGTTRQALGREAFLERVWAWKRLYGGAILDQMKRLGASVDWQREYFTMDANLSVAVREAFTRLYHEGLIYKGAYIVNWCPGCQTAISDLEVVHEETTGKLWEIRYPVANPDGSLSNEFLTIATTRPETMLGDVAVAIHPEDARYQHLHGKRLILPLTGREIPIVLDPWVSSDFGTGAVKITPAHDPNDFALAQRHHLPSINIMDDRARIALSGSKYDGLDRYEARKRIVEDLAEEGLLGTIHEHKLSLGRCDRSKDVVEPRLSEQWFVAVNKVPEGRQNSMAGLAIKAVKNQDATDATTSEGNGASRPPIRFTPSMYEKTYLNWMENIHDWCISRQLWWGHRIPAWHCAACRQITVPQPGQQADPTTCQHCGKQELHQETDVLDTWFSSGLLPVSVFGWPFLNASGASASTTAGVQNKSSHSERAQRAEEPASPNAGNPTESSHSERSEAQPRNLLSPADATNAGAPGLDSETWASTNARNQTKSTHSEQAQQAEEPASPTAGNPNQSSHSERSEAQPRNLLSPASSTNATPDFNTFYPTSLLVTGFDILFFWVARMIMLGAWFAQDVPMPDGTKRPLSEAVPFRDVYIHALVRDANREKMSKTKGNVIDPIEIVKQYGTDAVRFTLASMASPGTDIAFNVARTEGYRAFANKIWNAARFIFMNLDRAKEAGIEIDLSTLPYALKDGVDNYIESRWIRTRLRETVAAVTTSLSEYRFDEAASLIYQFFWSDFCDWYLEIVKLRLDFVDKLDIPSRTEALRKLLAVFEASLRLLSPFMPFLTEEIWHAVYDQQTPVKSIALTRFPLAEDIRNAPEEVEDMSLLQELIVTIRSLRKDLGVPEKEFTKIRLRGDEKAVYFGEYCLDILEKLAKVNGVAIVSEALKGSHARSSLRFDVEVLYEREIDIPAERERLSKEIAKLEKALASAERQLGNESFLAKAPANIVEGLKKQQSENRQLLEKAQAAITALG